MLSAKNCWVFEHILSKKACFLKYSEHKKHRSVYEKAKIFMRYYFAASLINKKTFDNFGNQNLSKFIL